VLLLLQSKDEDKSSQKSGPEVSVVVEDLQTLADQDEQSCGLDVSTSRSGTTSERRVTRASARSQQQRGRSSADGMLQTSSVFYALMLLPCCGFALRFSVILS